MGMYRGTGTKACEQCSAPIKAPHYLKRFCNACKFQRSHGGGKPQAHAAVTRAIKRGELPRADSMKCVDCGTQARDWDHRDYSKPLDVQPVCRSCNKKRGPGLPTAANA